LDFDNVMVGVLFVFSAPIAADEEMLGDEIAFDCCGVHEVSLK